MNARVIILTTALAAVACTKAENRPPQDRAAGAADAAAAANPTPAAAPAAPALSNGAETAGQTKDANNAGANDRNRQVAPAEQGSSAAETGITAAIRKGIQADDTLTSSPDVRVATVGTTVTLRGPVKNDQAKLAIAEIATRTVGVTEVDNQLVVKN